MPTVTWFDPTGAMHVESFATYDEAYSYEAALDCSDISKGARVDDPEWDNYMDTLASQDCDALEDMFAHDETCQQAHVRCAEAVYWKQDHASHVDAYWEEAIPF